MSDHDVLLMEAEAVVRRGVAEEAASDIRKRAQLVIEEEAVKANVVSHEAGVVDWASSILSDFESAIRKELCNTAEGKLKKEYEDILGKALKPEGIAQLAAVVLSVVRAINPVFAVSSLGVYVAVWLLKVGLNHWCSVPSTGTDA